MASIDKYDKVNIYKMNGDISDPVNMILTKNDYEHYLKKHPLFLTFLKKELVSNTFLFIGYSFSDALVLDCLSSISEFLGDVVGYHYAIMCIDEYVSPQLLYFVEAVSYTHLVIKKPTIASIFPLIKAIQIEYNSDRTIIINTI